jgi:hypothetical protein
MYLRVRYLRKFVLRGISKCGLRLNLLNIFTLDNLIPLALSYYSLLSLVARLFPSCSARSGKILQHL